MNEMTRRRFLKTSLASAAAASAAACATSGTKGPPAGGAPAPGRVLGANDRIRIALVGCGGMGWGDLILSFLTFDDVECPVLCDVDSRQFQRYVAKIEQLRGKRPDTVKDFRRVLERDDVDGVLIATPDHWHALMTTYACRAGKDVYCEKPLATSIGEGRAMVEAARRHERVVQVGTQWRSGLHWQEAVEYVHSGRLGKIRLVRCWPYLTWVNPVGRPADTDPPPELDYDLWLGPAPERPFNPARLHFNWRWFWDYAGGLQTDWGVHLINIAQWAMKVDAPKRVSSSGGKYVWDDISEVPDTQVSIFDYGDFTMLWEHQCTGGHGPEGREHGVAFHGTEATLIVDSHGWEVVPETDKKIKPAKGRVTQGDRVNHVRNFLDCMRSRQRPVTDIEIGHRATATGHLANIALRTGRTIQWDAENERILDDREASRLLMKPYRKPWELTV